MLKVLCLLIFTTKTTMTEIATVFIMFGMYIGAGLNGGKIKAEPASRMSA
jgi:hypothetical protein